MPVICPNVPDVIVALGLPNTGWLKMLFALDPGFEPPLAAQRERAEDRQVGRPGAGTVELVAARVAEADAGRLRERRGVEPLAGVADVAEDVVVADLSRPFWRVARRVQRRAARASPVNGVPLNAAMTPFNCQSPRMALSDAVVAAVCSATAAHRRSPSGSCAADRSPPAPSCATARSACSRSGWRGRRCRVSFIALLSV